MPHPSLEQTLETLQHLAPDSAFLALGQTVFWDEPLKASWRRILDGHWPSAQLIAGIHDTDYFAKTTAHVADDEEFLALPHDDGATRGLWSAAGELSSMFGSEDLPTRAFYESVGIPFDRLAGSDYAGRRSFFLDYTAAYGWRGVVQTVGTAQISHDISALKFGPALLSLLDWGFVQSLSCLHENSIEAAKDVADKIRGWVVSFLESCSNQCTLSDLYQYLLPKFYELLLDFEPTNFSITSTASLLKFNLSTAHLPRFQFVQLFLDPTTRDNARSAYSKAVVGGGMYPLEHFGEAAIPFDVVVPGVGRGTLHVYSDKIAVDFSPVATVWNTSAPVTTVSALAEVLSEAFGENVVLVGKAVSLISMLSAEFILIFHETASGYTDRTTAMNDLLRSRGIELKLNPILRLQYQTWDSLADVTKSKLLLPKHLANSFSTHDAAISPADFAKHWRRIVAEQSAKLRELKNLSGLNELLTYLASGEPAKRDHWLDRAELAAASRSALKRNFEQTAALRNTVDSLRNEIRELQRHRNSLEKQSGTDYSNRLKPAQERALGGDKASEAMIAEIINDRRSKFTSPISEIALHQRNLKKQIKAARAVKLLAERSEAVVSARNQITEIEYEANLAKLMLARGAYLTVHSLPHTNARPTSWWLPMVDPSGVWFDNITDSVAARLERV